MSKTKLYSLFLSKTTIEKKLLIHLLIILIKMRDRKRESKFELYHTHTNIWCLYFIKMV